MKNKQSDKEILLADIAGTIRLRVEKELNSSRIETHGLYSGAFGTLLFLSRYRKHAKDQAFYTQLHDRYLGKCLDEIASGHLMNTTFCNGLSGALYLLRKDYAGEIDITEAELAFDNYLLQSLKRFLANGNWDFLHGALGIGYYYLLRNDKNEIHQLLLDYLEEHSIREDGCRKIVSYSFSEKKEEYNISLSHGMASIIGYLSALYQKMPQERVKRLITEFTTFILRQRIDFSVYGSCFPDLSLEQSPLGPSRLAWCYGDLGVTCALYRASVALRNDEWMAIALSVLQANTSRRDLDKERVTEPYVCHGSAGIALIFAEMYRRIPKPEYKECANYWLEQTMLMWNLEKENKYDLLEGAEGVGLVMMTLLYDEQWADLLMI